MSDDTLQRLTALELSLQAEIRRLHSTVQDQAESQACVAHIRNLLTQHRGLLPTTSTTPPDIKLQLDAHRQIAADLEGQMRVAIIHSANRLRADSKNRALLGLQSGVPARQSQAQQQQELEELASLQRAHAALQDEVQRAHAALETFTKSSSTLRETSDEFSKQSSSMTTSRRLAQTIKQRECTDRWLIIIGIIFISLVSLSIINARLVGPLLSLTTWTSIREQPTQAGPVPTPTPVTPIPTRIATASEPKTVPIPESSNEPVAPPISTPSSAPRTSKFTGKPAAGRNNVRQRPAAARDEL